MVGVLAAVGVIEGLIVEAPQIYGGLADLVALVKRGLSGGPDPTPEEIGIAQQRSRDGLAQLQRDIDEGTL